MKYDKITPHSAEFEKAVLGALILSPDNCKNTLNLIHADLFYIEKNKIVFEAIESLNAKNSAIDLLLVAQELKILGKVADVGGSYYIAELVQNVANATNIEHHVRVLWQLYIFREVIKISTDAQDRSFRQNEDVFDLLSDVLKKFEKLDVQKKEIIVKKLSTYLESALAENSNDNKLIYLSGHEDFDNKLNFGPNNITLFGAGSGHGKTRFLIDYMKGLLCNNDDIAIMWCNMEDDTPKMIRGFVSCFTGLTNDQLIQRNYEYSVRDKIEIDVAKEVINKWDIEFIDRRMHSRELKNMFKHFCEQRPEKFNILLIDNVMKLKDQDNSKFNQTTIDDSICNNIGDIMDVSKRISKSSIIWVHHFNDEQQGKLNLKDGYRPRERNFKGSTRYCDTSTQIVMANRLVKYPDLVNSYKLIKDAMEHLFITDIAKNRNSETGIVRWFTEIGINRFKEIKE